LAQVASVSGAGNTFTVTFKQANVPFAAQVAQVPIVPEHVCRRSPIRSSTPTRSRW